MTLTVTRRPCAQDGGLADLQLHPVLRRVYAARGVRDATDLALTTRQLLRVGSLDSVDEAAKLLCRHRAQGGLVLIIGDFDADGATSTALLVRALCSWGFPAVDSPPR